MPPSATHTRFKGLRDRLADRWLALRAELHLDERAQREANAVAAPEVFDRKDEAAQRSLSDLEGTLEQRDVDEMAQIEGAVRRLEGGIYGACTDCGLPISHGRLQVQPAAPRCAPCQANFEQASKPSGPTRAAA